MYCVMRIEKRKKQDVGGLQKEANRTATEYNNRVQADRTGQNLALIHSNDWAQDVQREIDRTGAKQRANSVVALDTIYTASPQFFQGNTVEQNDQFFRDCLKFHQRHFGHIVSAVVHYDETTPHMHILSVPLTQNGRLSARDVVGNRAHMSHLQDDYFREVGKGYGLERGVHMDGQEKKQHVSAQEHRLQEVQGQLQAAERHAQEIEARRRVAQRDAEDLHQIAVQVTGQINEGYGELLDIAAQKQDSLDELGVIKHSNTHARARAKKSREKAQEQEMRNRQAVIDGKRISRELEEQKANLQAIKVEYKQEQQNLQKVHEQVEHLQDYLTLAEQRQAFEMYERNQERSR